MKLNFTKSLTLIFIGVFILASTMAQDASINILAGSGGVVANGSSFLLRVDVTNNDAAGTIVQNKLRPQISVPASISAISLVAADHTLPAGWTITSNSGSVIRITNTTDPIPAGVTRTAFIAVRGTALGTGSIIANLTFVGAAPAGDIGANNSSSTGIEVTNPTPVTLTDYKASLINCEPALKWVTEAEANSDRFEIERGNANNTGWAQVGVLPAKGNSTQKVEYNFADKNLIVAGEKVLYRLKMIDRDGRYTYSPTLPVFINCKTTKLFVYPNPVQDGKLYISLTGTTGSTEASLITFSGQVVMQSKINNGTSYLNVATVANGMYILNIKGSDGTDKKVKVLVQH